MGGGEEGTLSTGTRGSTHVGALLFAAKVGRPAAVAHVERKRVRSEPEPPQPHALSFSDSTRTHAGEGRYFSGLLK
jgi:hypothetical protein